MPSQWKHLLWWEKIEIFGPICQEIGTHDIIYNQNHQDYHDYTYRMWAYRKVQVNVQTMLQRPIDGKYFLFINIFVF